MISVAVLRCIYQALWWLIAPLAVLRLLWRSRHEAGYRRHIAERFGFGPAPALSSDTPATRATSATRAPLIWVHAVSVGETRGAQPLILALAAAFPHAQILITHMTPGGRATSEALFGPRVLRCYLPYDMPSLVRRFLRRFQPCVGIVMETEVWPTLIHVCQQAGVPLVLANARMSERSARRAARFGAGTQAVFGGLTAALAQTPDDARRLSALGVRSTEVLGNIKFDVAIDPSLVALGKRWRSAFGQRPVWVAASTREGEEALVLDAFAQQRATVAPDALLILVPRHPQRFNEVFALASRRYRTVRRSAWLAPGGAVTNEAVKREAVADEGATDAVPALPADTDILLGDSMGELVAWYGAADLAFIGGSLVPTGSHNLIEAAATGLPVLIGPHTFNFAQASAQAIECGAAWRVASAAALGDAVATLLSDPQKRAAMAAAAQTFADSNRGATARTITALSSYIPASSD